MNVRLVLSLFLGTLLATAAAAGEPGAAAPGDNPIRPAEPPAADGKAAPSGAAGKSTAHVRIKVLRPTEAGEREIILETEEQTVTVRETRREFSVAVQKPGGAAELTSAPTRDEFQKKFPELWKRWAEPALDATDPDKLAVEAMVRQTLSQIVADFTKTHGRAPSAEEKAETEKLLREEIRKALEANRAKNKGGASSTPAPAEGTPPKN